MDTVTKQFKGASTRDILAWHRPVASGVIAGSLFAFWFVYVYFHYTFTTYASRIATIAFIAGGAAAVTKRISAQSPEQVSAHMDRTYESIRPHVTKAVDAAVALMTWRDFAASAKAFVALIVLAFLGNWMSDTTLILIAMIVAFSAPVVYEKKQKEIDNAVHKAQAMADKYLAMLKTKAGAKKNQVEEQLDEVKRKNQ